MLSEGWSWVTFPVALGGACVAIAMSRVMAWTSDRPALWSMFFGGVFVFAVILGAALIAMLLTGTAFH